MPNTPSVLVSDPFLNVEASAKLASPPRLGATSMRHTLSTPPMTPPNPGSHAVAAPLPLSAPSTPPFHQPTDPVKDVPPSSHALAKSCLRSPISPLAFKTRPWPDTSDATRWANVLRTNLANYDGRDDELLRDVIGLKAAALTTALTFNAPKLSPRLPLLLVQLAKAHAPLTHLVSWLEAAQDAQQSLSGWMLVPHLFAHMCAQPIVRQALLISMYPYTPMSTVAAETLAWSLTLNDVELASAALKKHALQHELWLAVSSSLCRLALTNCTQDQAQSEATRRRIMCAIAESLAQTDSMSWPASSRLEHVAQNVAQFLASWPHRPEAAQAEAFYMPAAHLSAIAELLRHAKEPTLLEQARAHVVRCLDERADVFLALESLCRWRNLWPKTNDALLLLPKLEAVVRLVTATPPHQMLATLQAWPKRVQHFFISDVPPPKGQHHDTPGTSEPINSLSPKSVPSTWQQQRTYLRHAACIVRALLLHHHTQVGSNILGPLASLSPRAAHCVVAALVFGADSEELDRLAMMASHLVGDDEDDDVTLMPFRPLLLTAIAQRSIELVMQTQGIDAYHANVRRALGMLVRRAADWRPQPFEPVVQNLAQILTGIGGWDSALADLRGHWDTPHRRQQRLDVLFVNDALRPHMPQSAKHFEHLFYLCQRLDQNTDAQSGSNTTLQPSALQRAQDLTALRTGFVLALRTDLQSPQSAFAVALAEDALKRWVGTPGALGALRALLHEPVLTEPTQQVAKLIFKALGDAMKQVLSAAMLHQERALRLLAQSLSLLALDKQTKEVAIEHLEMSAELIARVSPEQRGFWKNYLQTTTRTLSLSDTGPFQQALAADTSQGSDTKQAQIFLRARGDEQISMALDLLAEGAENEIAAALHILSDEADLPSMDWGAINAIGLRLPSVGLNARFRAIIIAQLYAASLSASIAGTSAFRLAAQPNFVGAIINDLIDAAPLTLQEASTLDGVVVGLSQRGLFLPQWHESRQMIHRAVVDAQDLMLS